MTQPSVRNRLAQWLAHDHARLHALFKKAGASRSRQLAAALLASILGVFTLRSLNCRRRADGVRRVAIAELA